MWRRAPAYFVGKFHDRVFGVDESWLSKPREAFPVGSWQWLALTETTYGGFNIGVASKANRGGDRMSPFFHRYGVIYEEFLESLLPRREQSLTLVEVGILNGSGLAIWCDLFPNARVIGFDIDLRNFAANRAELEAAGAFSANRPELYEFDQLDLGRSALILKNVLGGTKVDVAIDDGCHSIESIKTTFENFMPHMAERFVYFIEDNFDTYDVLAPVNRHLRWFQRGEMTVSTRPFRP
ncbi:hypothetical protein KBY96_12265 [Cyanobium sp. ATX 6A2]|nr:hypothetical protein [Cyanobium sp. ATX 6A2]